MSILTFSNTLILYVKYVLQLNNKLKYLSKKTKKYIK